MAKRPPREFDVLAISDISRNMRRITLGGGGMNGFPAKQEGAYIKLALGTPEQAEPSIRTYTVRHQREDAAEIDVDFVLHGDHGIASRWALNASVGDKILVGGPGPKKELAANADWFFLVADMTALPALSVNLEAMDSSATGYAVIEILHEDDRQQLAAPAGMEIDWIVAENAEEGRAALIKSIREKPWHAGRPVVWAASEFDTMRAMRVYFKKERGIPTADAYISSYWKNGIQEDEHKRVKRKDAESE